MMCPFVKTLVNEFLHNITTFKLLYFFIEKKNNIVIRKDNNFKEKHRDKRRLLP